MFTVFMFVWGFGVWVYIFVVSWGARCVLRLIVVFGVGFVCSLGFVWLGARCGCLFYFIGGLVDVIIYAGCLGCLYFGFVLEVLLG